MKIIERQSTEMTAILHFRLPEDQDEFNMACHATEAYSTLHIISEVIRNQLKYGDPEEDRETLAKVRRVITDATCYSGELK